MGALNEAYDWTVNHQGPFPSNFLLDDLGSPLIIYNSSTDLVFRNFNNEVIFEVPRTIDSNFKLVNFTDSMHLIIGYLGHRSVRDTLLFGALQLKEPLRNFSIRNHEDTNKDTTYSYSFGHNVRNVEFPQCPVMFRINLGLLLSTRANSTISSSLMPYLFQSKYPVATADPGFSVGGRGSCT